jgi:hypothetical protein
MYENHNKIFMFQKMNKVDLSWIRSSQLVFSQLLFNYTGYFTNDNEPDGIENATHNNRYICNANVDICF